jgi:hypothetical protein
MCHRVTMRFTVVLLIALVLAAPARAAELTRYWSVAHVMRAIDGVRIRAGTRIVVIDRDTTLCSGEGGSTRRHGLRMWSRFACTFTTFTKRGLDRDFEFHVYVTGGTQFGIHDAHWIRAVR